MSAAQRSGWRVDPAVTTMVTFWFVILAGSTIVCFPNKMAFWLIVLLTQLIMIWLAVWLAMIFAAALRRRWRRAAVWGCSLLAAVPVGLACWYAGDDVHLLVMLPAYSTQLKDAEESRFDWGNVSLISAGVRRTLVHDPLDSAPELKRAGPTSGWVDGVRVKHLLWRFYLLEELR